METPIRTTTNPLYRWRCGDIRDAITIKTNTIMTQVKFFLESSRSRVEEWVNQFLQENANSIKVIDIKYTTPNATRSHDWTAMIICEIL